MLPVGVKVTGGAKIVSAVEPLMEFAAARMVVTPGCTPVDKPAFLMVATARLVEVHVTDPFRFCVLPSVYVPVAVSCRVVPRETEELAGVTAIDTSKGAVTVKVA